ncbi:c-type cytochrome [Azohydromonas aeria]|uniref:c-type cytochrome n=1 Tax=Azohydromonas aeria TaxID=2590212 RepID=UPI0012FCDD6D|nr:c-type cytochrome [Azohydromonas aeria]
MRKLWTALALACAWPAAGLAQTAERLHVGSLAATCANCHGTQGRAVPGTSMPPLAGVPREELLAQLQAFKAGSRPATIMHQLAKGYSDAQLEQIAAYFAAQPR